MKIREVILTRFPGDRGIRRRKREKMFEVQAGERVGHRVGEREPLRWP